MPVGNAALITRCPDCATAFRATSEQLAARDGRVRCGHCGAVFDAGDEADSRAAVPPEARESTLTPEASTAPATVSMEYGGLGATSADEILVLTPAPVEDRSDVPPVEVVETPQSGAAAARNLEFDFRRSRSTEGRLSPWFAWPAAFVLLLLLLAQLSYTFRGDLALLFPVLKPYAEELCVELGCDLPLPRRAELMSIEASDLQADSANPGVMVLSATLRNRAPFAQTPPALELTLTDTQDQPLARRVLTPADYFARGAAGGGAGNAAANLLPAGSEVPVKVFFEASSIKATGYRLYLFYP